jgi:Ca2+-binding RTX toxin-like protein
MSTYGTEFQLSTMTAQDGVRILGEAETYEAGYSVSAAGDINGDGIGDIIVGGEPYDDHNGVFADAAYVVFGKAGGIAATLDLSTLDSTSGFQINGEVAFDWVVYSVSSAGDVNRDGFDDIIVGAYGASLNGTYSGAAYVVFGKAGGFGANLNLSTLDGTTGFQISGEAQYDGAGISVSSAGDVNGDGFDDLIVGANGADPNGNPNSGAAYVVFGKAGVFDPNINLSALNGTNGFRISGEVEWDQAGNSVSSAGDVNGDGFDDVIVGAQYADPNGSSSGAAYVVFGKAGGFSATIDLSTLNGTTGFQISGEAAFDYAGYSVSFAGDVNGDGIDDLIVGTAGGITSCEAYVIFGNAGGFSANLDLSTLNGTTGFQISLEEWGSNLGLSVSAAGDVNGDGYDDIIVGDYGTGAAFVVFGKAGEFSVSFDLSTLKGTTGFQISGDGEGYLGRSVSAAGDVNDDGYDDLIVGAPGNRYEYDSGAAYIIYGKQTAPTSGADTLTGTNGKETILGLAGDDVLSGRDGNDRLDGGAGADRLTGGRGNDTYVTDGEDTIIEEADEGTDTVRSSVSFTLSANLENLSLTGSAAINGTGHDGANSMTGNGGANTLDGGGGNDTLDGGAGADRLIGGTGDDTYIAGAGDVIVETADEGTDTVRSSFSFTLSANLENLTLTGSAAINGRGNSAANTITGNTGANTLDGGGGTDRLAGGKGNDTYVTDGKDTIIEKSGEGTDTVRSSVSFTLSAKLENLTLTGSASINGTGHDGANSLTGNGGANTLSGKGGNDTLIGDDGNDRLNGGDGNDTLDGGKGADSLIGGSGSDPLFGGDGNDRLDGGNGSDFVVGGGGNDSLIGGSGGDLVIGGEGSDRLDGGSGNDTLDGSTGADRLIGGSGRDLLVGDDGNDRLDGGSGNDRLYGGKGADSLIGGRGNDGLVGDAGNDRLDGGAGDDILIGWTGQDVMTGGGGRDGFVFDTQLGSGNVDTITDFRVSDDGVLIEGGIFSGIMSRSPGFTQISASAFVKNSSGRAVDSNDRIIYETDTGRLYFDRDGTGSADRVHFATLDQNLNLSNENFYVFFY